MGTAETFPYNIKKALVTGGGGFVGKAVALRLLDLGIATRVVGRHRYPELEAVGAECCVGDISDAGIMLKAAEGIDLVFHVAALAGIWGKEKSYFLTNVVGTEKVIEACRLQMVPILVYTSTPSVVFNGKDIEGGDERLGYAEKTLCHYAASKIVAEKLVLNANTATLKTCALRPHLIWGPQDPHLLPRLVASGRKKQLKRVGQGTNLVDISYIDNVAHAHILAAKNLAGIATASGKPYFISQGKPVNLWNWINDLFSTMGVPRVTSSIPESFAFVMGGVLESFHTLVRSRNEPKMTRFLAEQLAKSHYFSIANAQKDLGYEPIVSIEEGLQRTVQWLKKQ